MPRHELARQLGQCYIYLRYSPTKRNMEVLIDRYTHMQVIEELPLLKMSTNISGHPRLYRDIKYCICNLHHLTIFCN